MFALPPRNSREDELLSTAIEEGNLQLAKQLIRSGNIHMQHNDFLEQTINHNQIEIAKLLIKNGADATENDFGETLLHQACRKGVSIPFLELLLENGCPDNEKNEDHDTPIRLAYEHGHMEIVDFLNRFVDDETDDSCDDSILDKAIKKKDMNTISFINSNGSKGSLYNAIREKQPEILKMLLNNTNAKWREDWSREWSPLHEACDKRYTEGVKLLLSNCFWKKAINWTNREQVSALHIAVKKKNNKEIIKMLVKNGANIGLRSFDYCLSPLETACAKGWLDIVTLMLGDKVYSDPEAGWSNDGPQLTALTCAAEHGHFDIVELLISHGYDIEEKEDVYGDTPLIKASKKGSRKTVEILLKNKASVNIQNNKGNTALHYAVRNKKKSIIELLLSRNANINIKNKSNNSPLDEARKINNDDLIKILTKGKSKSNKDRHNESSATSSSRKTLTKDRTSSITLKAGTSSKASPSSKTVVAKEKVGSSKVKGVVSSKAISSSKKISSTGKRSQNKIDSDLISNKSLSPKKVPSKRKINPIIDSDSRSDKSSSSSESSSEESLSFIGTSADERSFSIESSSYESSSSENNLSKNLSKTKISQIKTNKRPSTRSSSKRTSLKGKTNHSDIESDSSVSSSCTPTEPPKRKRK